MGIFDKFKSKKGDCWRNANGKIECPGDSCPNECDITCPIWCQTLAVQALQGGNHQLAISYFKKAASIAPDFKDAWVNMASVYGMMNNHVEANKAFQVAFSIDNNYEKAIRGLIASFKCMGHFDEAMMYCDIYERNLHNKAEADKLRQTVRDAQNSGTIKRQDTDMSMAMDAIKLVQKYDLLKPNDKMPTIPEILVEKNRTCLALREALLELGKTNKDALYPTVWFLWPIYAGMGAVYHWHTNWPELKKKGIPETLLEPRGVFAMDEYVLDLIGIKFDSEQGKEYNKKLSALATVFASKRVDISPNMYHDSQTLEFMQAMYILGMVMEMERLGMR